MMDFPSVSSDLQPCQRVSEEDAESSSEFKCDICGSPHVINPLRIRKPNKAGHYNWSRKMFDSITNTVLSLCNACGLRHSRAGVLKAKEKRLKVISSEERQQHTEETEFYVKQVADIMGNQGLDCLVCPNKKKKICQCVEKYVAFNSQTISERAGQLLGYFHKAEMLRQIKTFTHQRRTAEYQNFILETRQLLRSLGLCEFACQRILIYSNNFLHKKLKTAPQTGARLVKKSNKESLPSLAQLPKLKCCERRCTKLAITYPSLIASWRKNASVNRISARRTLAEMLIPSAGGRPNCINFLRLVTGCGTELICKVNKQMADTGGELEPPEHGLKLSRQHGKIMRNQKQAEDSGHINKETMPKSKDGCHRQIPAAN